MAKILNQEKINSSVQKLIETPDHLILNAHCYDKQTMNPEPFNTLHATADINSTSLNKNMLLNYNGARWNKTFGKSIVRDTNDPNIFYIFLNDKKASGNLRVLKVKEDENGLTKINYNHNTLGSGDYMVNEIVGQDSRFIYYVAHTTFRDYVYLYRMDKNTLALSARSTDTTRNYGQTYSLIKETDQYIYWLNTRRLADRLFRYDKYNHTTANIGNSHTYESDSNYRSVRSTHLLPKVDNENSGYVYSIKSNDLEGYYIYRIELDLNSNESDGVILGEKKYNVSEIFDASVLNNRSDEFYMYNFEYENKNYIGVILTSHEIVNFSDRAPLCGVYVFEVDINYDLVYKSFTRLSNNMLRNSLLNDNKDVILGGTQNSLIISRFDHLEERYMVTNEILDQVYSAGFDLNEDIWYLRADYEVHKISPSSPSKFNLEILGEDFIYQGDDILTDLSVEALNYDNDNIVTQTKLTITGNCIFNVNGGKNLELTTSDLGPTTIPITITGGGNVVVYPSLKL